MDVVLGLRNAFAVLGDVIRYRRQLAGTGGYELVLTTGTTPGTDTPLRAVYAGNGANRHWCISTTFDHYEEVESRQFTSAKEVVRELRKLGTNFNIVFTEGLDVANARNIPDSALCVPAWVRQRVRVDSDWHLQISAMRRRTRQELSRILRKKDYDCRISNSAVDFEYFYDHLYRPHISSRHGTSAIVVDHERFMRECNRGVILQLVRHESVVAATLLRRIGNTMAIIWVGMNGSVGDEHRRGATDALDYFSLLYAALKRCRWLDFGRSRSDLHDGALRYKRKWGTTLIAGLVPQSTVRIACTGRHSAEHDFLRGHAFLSCGRRGFIANLFIDTTTDAATLRTLIRDMRTPGITEYRIVALSGIADSLHAVAREFDDSVTLIETDTMANAMHAVRT